MNAEPSVTVIVLNWNSKEYLDPCLGALQQLDYPHVELLVVDNGSSDDSVDYIRTNFPSLPLIANERNLGYAGGNNLGLKASDADILVVLNPDVVVPRDWLRVLVSYFVADPTIGVAGCLLRFPGADLIQHAGGGIDFPQGWSRHIGAGETDIRRHAAVMDVDYVIGAAFAIRRQLFARIGGFDETFFLYYEDVDYCYRARDAGYRVVYAPTPPAVHHEAVTTRKESQFYLEQVHAGRWRFLLKHAPIEVLLADTVKAEHRWLQERSHRERRALLRAYRAVLHDLPQLWTIRCTEGGTQLDELNSQQTEMAAHLVALADSAGNGHTLSYARAARALSEESLQQLAETERRLHAASYVTEQPLISHAPVIGRFLTWIRNTWNNVATTWYVRPLLQQQNDYNALLYRRLEELTGFQRETYQILKETHLLLEALSERKTDDDRDVTELARRTGELAVALARLERRQRESDRRGNSSRSHGCVLIHAHRLFFSTPTGADRHCRLQRHPPAASIQTCRHLTLYRRSK